MLKAVGFHETFMAVVGTCECWPLPSTPNQVSGSVLVDSLEEVENEWEANTDERHRALALHPFNVRQGTPYCHRIRRSHKLHGYV